MKAMFTFLLVGLALFVSAQQNTFKVSAFAPQYGSSYQLTQLNDGSFIEVGENFYSAYDDTGYLLKTDAKGNVLAYKTLPTTPSANSVIKTNDGGFAVCGSSSNSVQLIKFKADLTIQWEKDYSIDHYVIINNMIQAADGSFLLVGAYAIPESNLTGYVIKTDVTGNLQFAKQYVGYASADQQDVELVDVAATTDGNYAVVARSRYNQGETIPDSAYIIKINSVGSVLWIQSAYSNTANQSVDPYRMIVTSDGGLLMACDLYTTTTYTSQMAMMKYNNAGTLLWSKNVVVNDPGTTDGYDDGVVEDKDGGYLFYGALDVYNNNDDTEYAYIAKTNATGTLQWTKKFYPPTSSAAYTEFYDMIKTSDGGYAACGDGYFFYSNINDYSESGFIFKLDQNLSSCDDSIASEGTLQNSITSVTKTATVEDVSTTVTDIVAFLNDAGETNLICSSNALPLQLLTFNATLQNKVVAVQWATANEINTNYYVVERSKDAATFTALQQVAAKGNSTSVQAYAATDVQPMPGTNYYRLKEVDKDGKITYSSIVPVTVLNNSVIVISPNPVRDAIKVVMQSAGNSRIIVQVIDMKGSILATQKASVTAGRNEITIPAASLAKGIYMLKVIENNAVQTIRFVKE